VGSCGLRVRSVRAACIDGLSARPVTQLLMLQNIKPEATAPDTAIDFDVLEHNQFHSGLALGPSTCALKTRTLNGSRADRETSYCFVAGAFELHMS
jgi:hypothetical protein